MIARAGDIGSCPLEAEGRVMSALVEAEGGGQGNED